MSRGAESEGRIWVKICGITNRNDAMEAIRSGADALGFNLWSKSKRFVPFEQNASWIAELPSGIERIAVLVNAPLDEALKVAHHAAFQAVQFHGTESSEYLREFAKSGRPFILAKRLEPGMEDWADFLTNRILIDAAVPGEFGGTGARLDMDLAGRFVERAARQRVILAGGLTPGNVGEAIRRVRPYGVDVASGVEEDGNARQKDRQKLSQFILAARNDEFSGSQ